MDFSQVIGQVHISLSQRDVTTARTYLETAWKIANTPNERTIAHDVGNIVQAAIFAEYLGE